MYISYVCRYCGKAQGTYTKIDKEKKRVKCQLCCKSFKLYCDKNPVKILVESYDLRKVNQSIRIYNANSNEVKYDWQEGKTKLSNEVEVRVYYD